MRNILFGALTALAAASLAVSADASINYNASKSNTGSVRCHAIVDGHRACGTHHVHHKPTKAKYDLGSGHTAGRRMH